MLVNLLILSKWTLLERSLRGLLRSLVIKSLIDIIFVERLGLIPHPLPESYWHHPWGVYAFHLVSLHRYLPFYSYFSYLSDWWTSALALFAFVKVLKKHNFLDHFDVVYWKYNDSFEFPGAYKIGIILTKYVTLRCWVLLSTSHM